MEKQQLMDNVNDLFAYFLEAIKQIPEVIQGRGLMLGVNLILT
jgi:acetylornithine aminotransferase